MLFITEWINNIIQFYRTGKLSRYNYFNEHILKKQFQVYKKKKYNHYLISKQQQQKPKTPKNLLIQKTTPLVML